MAIRAYSPVLATEMKRHPIENVELVRAALEATGKPQIRKKLAGEEELRGANEARDLAVALRNSLRENVLKRSNLQYVMPAVLETARAKRHSPVDVVEAFHENIKAKVLIGEKLMHVSPLIERMAAEGSDAGTLTHRLAALFSAGVEKDQMAEISQLLADVVQYGIDPADAAGFCHAAIRKGVLTPQQLPEAGRQLNNLLARMMSTEDAGKFYKYLNTAIGEKKIRTLRQLQLVVHTALFCATTRPNWNFNTLMEHASSAEEEIGDFEETLELQRAMIQRHIFPTAGLLVRLWKAPSGA